MNNPSLYFHTAQWPVLYSDNHLLALYKPAGLLTQGDCTGDTALIDLARQWIKEQFHKPGRVFLGLVHRIDRPVAGVVLFCRTSKAAGRISEQFRDGQAKKKYIAILEGALTRPSGRLINHVERRGASGRVVEQATGASREASLFFRRLDVQGSRTLIEIDLETGRHHQIRLQFAHIGHPVLGDLRYGAAAPLRMKQIALFAAQLAVIHPTTGQTMAFSAPLPRGWPWPMAVTSDAAPLWNWQEINGIFQKS